MEEINKIINKKPISKKVVICFTVIFAVSALLAVAGFNKAFATASGSFHDVTIADPISKGSKNVGEDGTVPGYVVETNICLGSTTSLKAKGEVSFVWTSPTQKPADIDIVSNKTDVTGIGLAQAYVVIRIGKDATNGTYKLKATDSAPENTCDIEFTVKDAVSRDAWGNYVETGEFSASSLTGSVYATTNLYARLNVEQISFKAPTQIGILANYRDGGEYYLSGPQTNVYFQNTCKLPLKISKLDVIPTANGKATPLSKTAYGASEDVGAYYIEAVFANGTISNTIDITSEHDTLSGEAYKMPAYGNQIQVTLPQDKATASPMGRAKNLTDTTVLNMWYNGLLTQNCKWTVVWDTA